MGGVVSESLLLLIILPIEVFPRSGQRVMSLVEIWSLPTTSGKFYSQSIDPNAFAYSPKCSQSPGYFCDFYVVRRVCNLSSYFILTFLDISLNLYSIWVALRVGQFFCRVSIPLLL